METSIFTPIIAITIVLSICFIVIKYFLYPLFFKLKLNQGEVFEFLKDQNIVFVDKRELNENERQLNPFNQIKSFSLKKMFLERTEYIIIGFSKSKKEHSFFWLELTQWSLIHTKSFLELLTGEKIEKRRNLIFKEITENQILTELKKIYESKTILINDKCPACQYTISDKINECPNCGLNFIGL